MTPTRWPGIDESGPLYYCGDDLQKAKVARMRAALSEYEVDAALFLKHEAVRWVTGFYAKGYRPFIELEYAALLVGDGPVVLGTSLPGEEALIGERARAEVLVQLGRQEQWPEVLAEQIEAYGLDRGRLGFDFLTSNLHEALQNRLPNVSLMDISSIWTSVTQVKLPGEVDLIRKALELAQMGTKVASRMVKSGSQYQELEVAAAAEYEMRRRGSEMTPFISLVASGPNSSRFQRLAGERLVGDRELVIVDFGSVYRGYTGDFARTLVRGRPRRSQQRLYQAVLLAQREAIKAISPGVPCSTIDGVARRVLAEEGYAEYTMEWPVGHQLGYGLHGRPLIAPNVHDSLQVGMVLNIEPAVCMPDHPDIGGVEIEDTLLVTSGGCEFLTDMSHDEDLVS